MGNASRSFLLDGFAADFPGSLRRPRKKFGEPGENRGHPGRGATIFAPLGPKRRPTTRKRDTIRPEDGFPPPNSCDSTTFFQWIRPQAGKKSSNHRCLRWVSTDALPQVEGKGPGKACAVPGPFHRAQAPRAKRPGAPAPAPRAKPPGPSAPAPPSAPPAGPAPKSPTVPRPPRSHEC